MAEQWPGPARMKFFGSDSLLTRPRYQSFLSVAYGVMLGLNTQTPEP